MHAFADALDIVDQVGGGVVLQPAMRRGAAAAALVEQDDAIAARVEKPAQGGRDPAARTAMQGDHGQAVRTAAFLDMELVAAAHRQAECLRCVDRRIQQSA